MRWELEVETTSDGQMFSVYDADGTRLTDPYISAGEAMLIAAAPELLLVAQKCLEIVETGSLPNWDWIRATIRKANGAA